MALSRTELVSLLSGELSAQEVATRHGLTAREVLSSRDAFLEGLKAGHSTGRRLRVRWLMAAVALVATVGVAQTLIPFAANAPALASEVNANFTLLKTWIEQKVGPVGSANISTAGTISAGAISGTDLTATGNTTLGSAGKTLTVSGTVAAFGASSSVALGTNLTAPSDGMVFVNITSIGGCDFGPSQAFGYAGAGAASQLRGQASVHGGCTNQDYATAQGSFLLPVRKGEVYRVDLSGNPSTTTATFMPFGR